MLSACKWLSLSSTGPAPRGSNLTAPNASPARPCLQPLRLARATSTGAPWDPPVRILNNPLHEQTCNTVQGQPRAPHNSPPARVQPPFYAPDTPSSPRSPRLPHTPHNLPMPRFASSSTPKTPIRQTPLYTRNQHACPAVSRPPRLSRALFPTLGGTRAAPPRGPARARTGP